MNIYYVYAYLREDLTPYYIGKGKGHRAYVKDHNVHVPRRDRIIILEKNLEEQAALNLEELLIKQYGRKDLGTGILMNKTDGGRSPVLYGAANGMTGKKHTEETLRKISQAKKGVKHKTINTNTKECPYCNEYKNTRGFTSHIRACTQMPRCSSIRK